jgi:hypothetical protein
MIEAACWSHGRRNFFDLAKLNKAPIAIEAVRRIDELLKKLYYRNFMLWRSPCGWCPWREDPKKFLERPGEDSSPLPAAVIARMTGPRKLISVRAELPASLVSLLPRCQRKSQSRPPRLLRSSCGSIVPAPLG